MKSVDNVIPLDDNERVGMHCVLCFGFDSFLSREQPEERYR